VSKSWFLSSWIGAAALSTVAFALPALGASIAGDSKLAAIGQTFFNGSWEFRPADATSAGVHQIISPLPGGAHIAFNPDSQLGSVTPAAFASEIERLHKTLDELQALSAGDLSLDGRADRQLLMSDIGRRLFALETRPEWRMSPNYYVDLGSSAVFSIVSRDFAPLSERMLFVTVRESKRPAMLAQGEKNIVSSEVPAIYAQTAQLDALGAADFLEHDVASAFAPVDDNPTYKAEFVKTNAAAAAAFRSYAAFIKQTVVPDAHAPFAIGADAYEHLEALQNVDDIPLSRLLAVGEANLSKDKAAFIATAREIDPNASPTEVADKMKADHPTADRLIPTAQSDLNDLVAFIKSKHILDLPDAPVARAVPTPQFERQFTFASMDSPGPLETNATEAYYNVTPVEPTWTSAQSDEHLGFFNRYNLLVVSAHETYPGHYTNYLFNKQTDLSLIRKLEWNVAFGEGWAHYDEQMVVDEGLGGGDPRYRLAQLSGALQRDCRYIVGIKEHTQGMTIEQATQFLMDNGFMGREPAYREAVRGTGDPLYGYYTLGKLMLLKLRSDYQAKMGAQFDLAKFHDALLSHGDPPIYYIRRMLLGADDKGSLL
jgi:uncharacterized protein (DUF885 family)